MNHSLIIYDGDCAFCTWCILFVIERSKAELYRFTSLHSTTANEFFSEKSITDTEAIWLVEENRYFHKSSAVLRIVGRIGGVYTLVYIGFVVPRIIRDWAYDYIARRRKRLMRGNVCPIIPEKYQHLFVE